MPDFSIEQKFGGLACGIDEVGRGPLAGPVVAACVYIPLALYDLPLWAQVNDSKKLSPLKRELLATQIRQTVAFGLGLATVEEIDQFNILQATFLAMTRAYEGMRNVTPAKAGVQMDASFRWHYKPFIPSPSQASLGPLPLPQGERVLSDHPIICSSVHLTALIDGNRKPKDFPIPVLTVIKGDTLSASIAAASIIAKVERDEIMARLARDHPEYGWDQNAGYGTPGHLAALAQHGPCPHHRRSFAPVRNAAPTTDPLAKSAQIRNK